jgi:sacsin
MLSEKVYTPPMMRQLLKSLTGEGHLYLLFLKNVEKIEFHHKSSKFAIPSLVYSVTASAPGKNKTFFAKKSPLPMSYQLDVEAVYGNERKLYSYWVTQAVYKSSRMGQLAKKLKLIPLVGAALPLHNFKDLSIASGGQLFCFLPLPLQGQSPTGLSVHVNGYFALDQNRRHLKLPSADQSVEDLGLHLEWNMRLISELIPRCLANLLTSFVEHRSSLDNFSCKVQKSFNLIAANLSVAVILGL